MSADSAPVEGEVLVVRAAGLSALVACHWTRSPVGPFAEVLMVRPRRGRPRLQVVTLAVGSREAALDGLGPAAALRWWSGGRRRELFWESRGLRLRLETATAWMSAALPVGRLHPEWLGNDVAPPPARLATVHLQIEVSEGDPLTVLTGRRRGLLLSSATLATDEHRSFLARPARVPPAAETP
jgi:hypothetical protein